MPQSQWRRKWVKFWVNECLEGTVRFDFSPAERGVWYDLIMLAGRCRVPGTISANEHTAYPHSYIAGLLNVELELLETTLKKCVDSGRVTEDSEGIHLTNWPHYQSEYQRQKPYRVAGRSGNKIHKLCPVCGFKALTNETYCPKCAEEGKENELRIDYKGGKYGHMVQG